MAVRKIGKSWRVDFWHDGRRYRIKGPENTRAGAEAYEAALRQKFARGEPIDKAEAEEYPTFEDFSTRWLEEYVIPNNKHQEQRMKGYILGKHLTPYFGKMGVEEIRTQDIERFKAHVLKTGLARKTVNNQLAVLGKCIRTAYEWLELPGAPPKIALLRCPPPKTENLSPDECELLYRSADGIIKEIILTALRTGMRQGELRGLQWPSIDWRIGPS